MFPIHCAKTVIIVLALLLFPPAFAYAFSSSNVGEIVAAEEYRGGPTSLDRFAAKLSYN